MQSPRIIHSESTPAGAGQASSQRSRSALHAHTTPLLVRPPYSLLFVSDTVHFSFNSRSDSDRADITFFFKLPARCEHTIVYRWLLVFGSCQGSRLKEGWVYLHDSHYVKPHQGSSLGPRSLNITALLLASPTRSSFRHANPAHFNTTQRSSLNFKATHAHDTSDNFSFFQPSA